MNPRPAIETGTHLRLRRAGIAIALAAWIAGSAAPASAIVNGFEPAADDTRFDAVGAFSRTDWLRAGPDRSPEDAHNWFGAATLIAPDTILTARHNLPDKRPARPYEFAVRFRRHVTGSVGSRQAGPDSYHLAPVVKWVMAPHGEDLAMGILVAPVTHIDPIPVDTRRVRIIREPGFVAAWGSESRWLGAPVPRRRLLVGRNLLARTDEARETQDRRPLLSETHPRNLVFIMQFANEKRNWQYNSRTRKWRRINYVTTDAGVPNSHDSGGALLIEDERGMLKLLGVIKGNRTGLWPGRYVGSRSFPIPVWRPNRH